MIIEFQPESGYVRATRWIFGMPFGGRNQPTFLSHVLGNAEGAGAQPNADWYPVQISVPMWSESNRIHGGFYDAIAQVERFEQMAQKNAWDAGRRREFAHRLVETWLVTEESSWANQLFERVEDPKQ